MSAAERLAGMLARFILEPDEARAAELCREYGRAATAAAAEAWGERLQAAEALLDAAESALDRAAMVRGRERQRHIRLAALLIDAAQARPAG
jgi:hypothetical protein